MEVLSNRKLANRISELCHSTGPRKCAVAFWGKEIPGLLFPDGTDDVEIVLDIAMGGTTKSALTALGVPSASNVWVRDGLHTKLYIGQAGAIICSANASINALGRDFSGGKLEEIGVWIDAKLDRDAYRKACEKFEKIKGKSDVANQSDLDRAPERSPGFMNWSGAVRRSNSLIDTAIANPQDFGGVLFVFGDSVAERKDEEAAAASYKSHLDQQEETSEARSVDQPRRQLVAYCRDGSHENFDRAALVAMFWGAGKGFEIFAYSDLVRLSVKRGRKVDIAYYGRRDWRKFKNILGLEVLGTLDAVLKADRSRAKKLAGEDATGNRWQEYVATDLADALVTD